MLKEWKVYLKNYNLNSITKAHHKILYVIGVATTISWLSWILVIMNLDPYESTRMGLSLFFVSLTLSLIGTFTIILFFLKKLRNPNEVYIKHVMISLRQGILLSASTTVCLAFLMLGLLRIWNGLLIVIIITLLEFYLSGKDELN